jgi:RimJ/RimL family protein N-acetyltransferase
MPVPDLRGAQVVLRAPRPTDVDDRLAAGRDPEFRRMVGATRPVAGPLTRADAERWYAALRDEPQAWVIELEGRCIGEARLHHVDAAAGEGWVALGLFAPEHRGRGLGTEAVRLLLAYAFGALGLATIRLRVLVFNAPALACYRRCGFREVGREPVRLGAEATEDVLMAVTREEVEQAHAECR